MRRGVSDRTIGHGQGHGHGHGHDEELLLEFQVSPPLSADG